MLNGVKHLVPRMRRPFASAQGDKRTRECHAERSEVSRAPDAETLRQAQGDKRTLECHAERSEASRAPDAETLRQRSG